MPSLSSDILGRIAYTGMAVVIAQIIVVTHGIDKWWAVAIAAGVTGARALLEGFATNPAGLLHWNALERLGWTAAEAAAATLTVDSWHSIPPIYLPLVAAVIAAIKAYIAPHLGAKGTAAIIPARYDVHAAVAPPVAA